MERPVKYRKHIDTVWRMPPDSITRLDKLRLDKNERITPFSDDFWQRSLARISQEAVQACPEVWPLYERLSRFHGLSADYFLLTAGSDTAIRYCFEAFVSPGDTVFYPDPTFAMVPVYGELYQADMHKIGYDSRLQFKLDDLLAAVSAQTSLVILANPNSPTGTHVPNERIRLLLDKAAHLRIPVLIDEAYYGFCPHTVLDMLADFPNLIVTRSFSKIAGMAGIRVGYAIGRPEVVQLLTKFRPMYEINSIGVSLACAMLDEWSIAEEYARETIDGRDRFVLFLADSGFQVVNTETNFIHVDFGSLKEEILDDLKENGILVRGLLTVPGYENYTRFSVGPRDAMQPAIEVIKNVLAQAKHN